MLNQKTGGKMTLIDSGVKLKKKHLTKQNQNKCSK